LLPNLQEFLISTDKYQIYYFNTICCSLTSSKAGVHSSAAEMSILRLCSPDLPTFKNKKLQNGIESIRNTRIHLLKLIENLSVDDLNKVPAGFNNNVIWNLGHLIAAQQSICYLRGGITTVIDENHIKLYKPGTKPEAPVSEEEILNMKELFLTEIDQFGKDYDGGLFAAYPAWTNGYGMDIHHIEDAISFVLFHEGLHRGYIMALKRIL
jgi:hypothetical protein